MKRNLIGTSSLVVLSLLLTVAGAFAQSRATASVPFAFEVNGSHLPAGTYSIQKDADTAFIDIQSLKTGSTVMVLGRPGPSGKKSNVLVFTHVGGGYVLSQIWGDAGKNGIALPASRREKEMQVARVTPRATDNVLIALK
jgi:hypothetical protein